MKTEDTSVFSKVMAKVSSEFLTRLLAKQEIYQAFLELVKNRPGVELIYDQRKNTWYIGGSWDAICLIRQQMIVLIDCIFTFGNIQPLNSGPSNAQFIVMVNAVRSATSDASQMPVPSSGCFTMQPPPLSIPQQQQFHLLQQSQQFTNQTNSKNECFTNQAIVPRPSSLFMSSATQTTTTTTTRLNITSSLNSQSNSSTHFGTNLNIRGSFKSLDILNCPSDNRENITGRGDKRDSIEGGSPCSTDSNNSIIDKFDRIEDSKNFSESFLTSDLLTSLNFDSSDDEDKYGNDGSEIIAHTSSSMTTAILDLSRKVDAVSVNETFIDAGPVFGKNSQQTELLMPQKISDSNIVNVEEQECIDSTLSTTNVLNTSTAEETKLQRSQKKSNTCNICNKTFLNKSNMIRHARSIHKVSNVDQQSSESSNSTQKVAETPNKFSLESLKRNPSPGKDSIQNRSCRFCLKVFSTRSNLYKHARKCKRAHKCASCDEKFETHDLLSHHTYTAHSLFLCRMCDQIADSEESYADHVNFCHPNYSLDDAVVTTSNDNDTSTSDSCQTVQDESVKGDTTRHQPFVRSGSCMGAVGIGSGSNKQTIRCHRPNPCLKCGKVFSTFSNLLKHIRVIHENARFPCNLCKRVFACKDGLKNHMDKIHCRTTHKCDVCSLEFDNQLRLAKHLNLIHNQQSSIYNFQCELCGKTFLYKTNLKRHKKMEHDGMRYSCQRCNTSFRSKIQLNEHHRIVHLGLLLKCDACDKHFHTWTTLRDHERAAHGKHAPIVCAVCGKKFTRYPGLSYHLRRYHKRKYNVAGEITANHVLEDKKQMEEKKKKKKSKYSLKFPNNIPVANVVNAEIRTTSLSSLPLPSLSSVLLKPPSLCLPSTSFLTNIKQNMIPTDAVDESCNKLINNNNNTFLSYNGSYNNSTYVPSFYDQHFQLQDAPPGHVQKTSCETSDNGCVTNRTVPYSTPLFVTSPIYDPSVVTDCPHYVNTTNEVVSMSAFNNNTLYNNIQETPVLCLSDTINFYDNFSPSPEQQSRQHQQQLSSSSSSSVFHSDEFVMFHPQQF